MSKSIRRLAFASVLAAALALIPVSLSSDSGVAVNEVCASGECESTPRGMCVQPDGPPIANARAVVG